MQDLRWPIYAPRGIVLQSYVREGAPPDRGTMRVQDDQGNVYLDAIGGIGCLPLGHGHPEPLHDDEHARMQSLDSVQAVLALGLMAKHLHHTLGESLTHEREELRVVAERTAIGPSKDRTHWRHGTGGSRWSTSSAAVSPIRRPIHEGQIPRLLHAKGTRSESPQRRHSTTKKPCPKSPQAAKASISSHTNAGKGPACISTCSRNAGQCSRTIATASQCCVLRGT
jgi:hypothetical protein